MECVKSWVAETIDESFWDLATSYHGAVGVYLQELTDLLNANKTTADTPKEALKEAEKWYERISTNMGKIN